MAGRTSRTFKKGDRLLRKLASGYSILAACKAEGIARSTYYEWRNSDPEFATAADDAIEAGTDTLEDAILTRAKTTSDTLAIFLLKARRRDKYGDKLVSEHTGKDGAPLTININRVTGRES